MSKIPLIRKKLDRRQTLALLGSVGVALAAGCESTESTSGAGGSGGAGGTGGTGGAGGEGGEGGEGGAGGMTSSSTGTTGKWATGGTASMGDDYPDPFTAELGTMCALTCSQTLGPCYGTTEARKDISEGRNGLPTRLSLLVVDETCKPIEGATVDIWHAAPEGAYSDFAAGSFCNPSDDDHSGENFFRGVQTTDAEGRVDFNTCFPGWYPGRSIHVHFTIRLSNSEYVTSQLYFPDALCDDIVASAPIYSDRGPRDTTNQNDGVISAAVVADYTADTAQMPDGSLHAWKVLVIRSSLQTALCTAPGGMGGPPMP